MNAPEQHNALAIQATAPSFELSPRTFEQALTFAGYLADSDMVPKDFKGRPGNCLIAIQWGAELGLKPLQAMQNLAIINGRPSLWGDAVIALVRASPLCEYIIETETATASTCTVKRRGEPEQARTFTDEDAAKAGLKGKAGPWSQFPKRMRQMRARAFALRDVFPDVLRGLPVAEEIMDAPPTERYMGAAEEVKPAAKTDLPACLQADLDRDLPKMQKIIDGGKKTAAELLSTMSTKATFTEEQKAQILALVKTPPPAEKVADDDFVRDMNAAEGVAQ